MDIEKLKECCKRDRDRAIVTFLLSTGCRISELCELDVSSIDFRNKECIVHGKGDKERVVFLDDVSSLHLVRYLDDRDDRNPALFVGRRCERLHPNGIRAMLKRLGESSGVENVHPHRFRRTLATNLINRGMPIQEVSTILGHDKLDTTLKYIYMSKDNVKVSYQKYT